MTNNKVTNKSDQSNSLFLKNDQSIISWSFYYMSWNYSRNFSKNCKKFRIKPKRKRSKKKKHNVKMNPSYGITPKSTNFLQILCYFCGWKTRHIGATTKQGKINNRSLKDYSNTSDMLCQTPRSSEKTSADNDIE